MSRSLTHPDGCTNSFSSFGVLANRKLLLFKKNMAPWLRFTKSHLNKPQSFLNNVLWTHETKVVIFDHNAHNANTTYQHRGLTPSVKNAGGGLMICFKLVMSASVYQSILASNLRPSVQQLKLGYDWVMQQVKDAKYIHIQQNSWNRKEWRWCKWTSQSLDLNLNEMLWRSLKRAVHKWMPTNINELKQQKSGAEIVHSDVRDW